MAICERKGLSGRGAVFLIVRARGVPIGLILVIWERDDFEAASFILEKSGRIRGPQISRPSEGSRKRKS